MVENNNVYQRLSVQLPYLKKYLIPKNKSNKKNKSNRKMQNYYFDNIRVGGELIRSETWQVSFYVSFYCCSTNYSMEIFSDNFEFQRWVRKNKIGLRHIKDDIINNIHKIPWWSYDPDLLVFYNHEHDVSCLKMGKPSFFEIEITLQPPDTLSIGNDVKTVQDIHCEASNWVSNLSSFSTDKYVQFTSASKKTYNIK